MKQRKYALPPEATNYDNFSSSSMQSTWAKNKYKERFTDKQVKCLASMFQMTQRIEPRKKVEVAKELGLQPRQVGIWFQNKRARYKSKQMEDDYIALKARFNILAYQYEAAKIENETLTVQLEQLRNQLKEQEEKGKREICLAQEIVYEGSKKMFAGNLYELVHTAKEELPQLPENAEAYQTLPESWYKLGGDEFSVAQIWDF